MALSMGSDIQMLSPQEDALAIPASKRPMIDDKKEKIEYFFRIAIYWQDDSALGGLRLQDHQSQSALATLLLRGVQPEREMATKYIQALYETGPEYKDDMVAVPIDMYAFISAAPVLRHIIRESGAVVLVTIDGVAHVYGTDLAVSLAVSLFEYLTSSFERGWADAALTIAAGGPSSSSSTGASSTLAPFVAANEVNLNWNPREFEDVNLPGSVDKILVQWLLDDLTNMGFTITNPSASRPRSSPSPVTSISRALRGTSVNGMDTSSTVSALYGTDGTIIIDDDEELDVIVEEPRRERTVRILPRPLGTSPTKLPVGFLSGSGGIATSSAGATASAIHPPPHPLLRANDDHFGGYHDPASAGDPAHSPRPPSNKRGCVEPRNENNIGNSKKDPISNNSNKFKENFTTTNTTTILTGAETPGITNRKVKLKSNNNGSGDSSPRSTEGNHQGSNPDDWMADLTPREVQMIMDSENIENYSNYANHMREKREITSNNSRTNRHQSHSPPHTIPPPAPDQLVRSRSHLDTTERVSSSNNVASFAATSSSNASSSTAPSSSSTVPPLPYSSLRRIVIDGSNVAMAHGNNKRFSCRGIWIVVKYFLDRGHEKSTIKVFIPQWRQNIYAPHNTIDNPELLERELKDFVSFTPCRKVDGMKMNSYDDRFIIMAAAQNRGVVVSNDKFKDIFNESPAFKDVITNRLLPYCFMEDIFMPPADPMGRDGPMLDEFLTIYRPEMELYEHARPKNTANSHASPQRHHHQQQQQQQQPQQQSYGQQNQHQSRYQQQHQRPRALLPPQPQPRPQVSGFNFSAPVVTNATTRPILGATRQATPNQPTGISRLRSADETRECRDELRQLFSANARQIDTILDSYPAERSLDLLASHVLSIIQPV